MEIERLKHAFCKKIVQKDTFKHGNEEKQSKVFSASLFVKFQCIQS